MAEASTVEVFMGIPQDLRFAVRSLCKKPAFALVAILSLSIGIGATTAVFSAVNALLLRPVQGIPDPELVVEVGRTSQGYGFDTFSYPDFLDLQRDASGLDRLAAWQATLLSFTSGGAGENVASMLVSADYFDVLGMHPAAGRFFLPAEDQGPGSHPVVVISHSFWRDRFQGRQDVVGQTLLINRHPFTIVGIAPEAFHGHQPIVRVDFWVPLMMRPVLSTKTAESFEQRNSSSYMLLGRLPDSNGLSQARASVNTVMQRLATDYPETNRTRGARVEPLGNIPAVGRSIVAAFLGALLALSGIVLLVTCANVAGMLLVRSAARVREIAIRLALGVGRWRLVRLLIVENVLLFVVGGGLGFLLAWMITRTISSAALPIDVPLELNVETDWRVLGFSLLMALTSGMIFGLLPALQSTRVQLVNALKQQSGIWDRRRRWLRQAFVMGQVGLSLCLLVASGLFLRSLQRAASIDTGFRVDNVLLTSFDLAREGYGENDGRLFLDRLKDRLSALPGVAAAGFAIDLPLDLSSHGTGIFPEGWEKDRNTGVEFNYATPGFFEALRIEALRGRLFDSRDVAGSEQVALITPSLANRVWPDQEALGKRFRFGDRDSPWIRVVGIVPEVYNQVLNEAPEPFVYLPLKQQYRGDLYLTVRSEGPVEGMPALLRRELLAVDPSLAFGAFHTLQEFTGAGILPQKLAAAVSTSLAAVALLLSVLGLYGVVAFAAAQRTREIGLRMALGARAGDVIRLVMRTGVLVAVPGLAIGLLLALGLGKLLQSFLLGVSPFDPSVLAGVSGAFLIIVIAAGLTPSVRAARIDPSTSLRDE